MPPPLVNVGEVLWPQGPVQASLIWPGQDQQETNAHVAAFLLDGERETADFADEAIRLRAIRQWAVWRAFDAGVDRLLLLPASADKADQGGQSYLATQINLMIEKRDAARQVYDDLVLEDAGEEEPEETFTVVRSYRDAE